jgi:hypothetical protein
MSKNNSAPVETKSLALTVVMRPLAWFIPYAKNPRKNDAVVGQMIAAIREFGFVIPNVA